MEKQKNLEEKTKSADWEGLKRDLSLVAAFGSIPLACGTLGFFKGYSGCKGHHIPVLSSAPILTSSVLSTLAIYSSPYLFMGPNERNVSGKHNPKFWSFMYGSLNACLSAPLELAGYGLGYATGYLTG